MHTRNLEKLASIDAQLRALVPGKVSEDDKLVENNATTESDIEETFKKLVVDLKKSPQEVFDALKNQTIRDCLAQLYAKDITPDDKQELDEAAEGVLFYGLPDYNVKYSGASNVSIRLSAAFRTDEIRRTAPTPQDEMRAGMSYFHETIWKGVPKFLRRVGYSSKNIGINEIQFLTMSLLFNSPLGWVVIGMVQLLSCNPRVTPEVTRDVCLLARMMAANLYYSQIEDLMFEYVLSVIYVALQRGAAVRKQLNSFTGPQGETPSTMNSGKHPPSEPYRVVLGEGEISCTDTSWNLLSSVRSLCDCGDRAPLPMEAFWIF
ncbi:Phosphoenolpyruvate carboxylase 1 [Datura stramonium]|uniref:Phosphoenolpyruvate carboxylase 1 n=1 Tax=Datura stramonium TaxID=4076 RepID=A0ABS8RS75_DATST|nr:Phosphoenolpyruvate carboxylase 1 [Datura stramonium]